VRNDSLTNDQAGIDVWELLHQVPDDRNGRVVGLGHGEDNLKEGVVLAETRGQVLVHVAVNATEWADDRDTRHLFLCHSRRQRPLVACISPAAIDTERSKREKRKEKRQ